MGNKASLYWSLATVADTIPGSYVVLTAITTTFLGEWHAGYVAQYRKVAKVPCQSPFPRSGPYICLLNPS